MLGHRPSLGRGAVFCSRLRFSARCGTYYSVAYILLQRLTCIYIEWYIQHMWRYICAWAYALSLVTAAS